jgi:hypothetical protein
MVILTHRSTHRLVLLTLVLILLFPTITVLADPPDLPASFYGRVWVSGASAPAGSTIFVYTGELELSSVAVTQNPTYGAVYALNIPADNPETGLIDGGKEGDILTFYVQLPSMQRMEATRTSVWRSGANVALDLSFSDEFYVYLPMITTRYLR